MGIKDLAQLRVVRLLSLLTGALAILVVALLPLTDDLTSAQFWFCLCLGVALLVVGVGMWTWTSRRLQHGPRQRD